MAVSNNLRKLGFLAPLGIGLLLVLLGGWFVNQLVNNTWLIPLDHPQFVDFQRAVVEGRLDSLTLLREADDGLLALFFLSVVVIGTGVALPIAYLANRRVELVRGAEPASLAVMVRQAVWFGGWLAFCSWLQMSRTFGPAVALLVLIVFVLFEVLFHVRRRSAENRAA